MADTYDTSNRLRLWFGAHHHRRPKVPLICSLQLSSFSFNFDLAIKLSNEKEEKLELVRNPWIQDRILNPRQQRCDAVNMVDGA